MKKKWIKDLGENEVIHTPEEWMAEKVVKVLRDMGMRWSVSYWFDLGSNTCYKPFCGAYDSIDYYKSNNATIYSFNDILDFQESEDKLEELEKFMGETISRLEKLLPTRPSLDYDEVNRLRDEHEEMKEMLAEINECRTSFDRWGDIEYLLNKINKNQ